jgi:hypothetical protein
MRDTRNLYGTFISLMNNQILTKYQFDADPLAKSYLDYKTPNHYIISGKQWNELELEMKNRDNELMIQA